MEDIDDKKIMEKREEIELIMKSHYYKLFDKFFNWVKYQEPEDLKAVTSVFSMDREELALEQAQIVLDKWRKAKDKQEEDERQIKMDLGD